MAAKPPPQGNGGYQPPFFSGHTDFFSQTSSVQSPRPELRSGSSGTIARTSHVGGSHLFRSESDASVYRGRSHTAAPTPHAWSYTAQPHHPATSQYSASAGALPDPTLFPTSFGGPPAAAPTKPLPQRVDLSIFDAPTPAATQTASSESGYNPFLTRPTAPPKPTPVASSTTLRSSSTTSVSTTGSNPFRAATPSSVDSDDDTSGDWFTTPPMLSSASKSGSGKSIKRHRRMGSDYADTLRQATENKFRDFFAKKGTAYVLWMGYIGVIQRLFPGTDRILNAAEVSEITDEDQLMQAWLWASNNVKEAVSNAIRSGVARKAIDELRSIEESMDARMVHLVNALRSERQKLVAVEALSCDATESKRQLQQNLLYVIQKSKVQLEQLMYKNRKSNKKLYQSWVPYLKQMTAAAEKGLGVRVASSSSSSRSSLDFG